MAISGASNGAIDDVVTRPSVSIVVPPGRARRHRAEVPETELLLASARL
jgi:hypothetical protein